MIALVRELFHHQAYADAALINAIRAHDNASQDQELRLLLHHIHVSHRFWLHLCQEKPFSVESEKVAPDSIGAIAVRFQKTQEEEQAWLTGLREPDLIRTLESPHLPGRHITVSEALVQVCLHSQGHRSQCASRLRVLGGEPPLLDYIAWLKDRPSPVWT